MRILAISGSLRAASLNAVLLRAARDAVPPGIKVLLYEGVGHLPHYSPDLEAEALPPAVAELRCLVGGSAGVLIAFPEYAHGIPGAFENALDWLVGSTEFAGKPVALLNVSHRATHAQAALREVLATMSARLVPEGTQGGSDVHPMGALQTAVAALVAAAQSPCPAPCWTGIGPGEPR